MAEMMTREEAYAANVITGWEAFAYNGTANNANGKFRNAGSGNGVRTWGLSEDGLPMGASGYMRIDTSAESCTNKDNTIAQDSVPLAVGETYAIGAFVRGKGYFTCGPTQDGYYRAATVHVDHPGWRFYGGEFAAKTASQSMYWRNECTAADDDAGALEICAPLLVRGGVAPMIIATSSCTLAVAVDVAAVDTFYKLQASTAAAPSKPAEASPSGWMTAEPTYDGTATNTLYTCQKTTLTDGTFYWGEVSVSSSYEAAKQAWNKANAAQEGLDASMEDVALQLQGKADQASLDTTTDDVGQLVAALSQAGAFSANEDGTYGFDLDGALASVAAEAEGMVAELRNESSAALAAAEGSLSGRIDAAGDAIGELRADTDGAIESLGQSLREDIAQAGAANELIMRVDGKVVIEDAGKPTRQVLDDDGTHWQHEGRDAAYVGVEDGQGTMFLDRARVTGELLLGSYLFSSRDGGGRMSLRWIGE